MGWMLPEFMNNSVRSCCGLSAHMERMIQMSSMRLATSGNNSVI